MMKYFRFILYIWASLVAQLVKNPPAMQTWVQSLGWDYLLEKGKATYPLQYSGQENPWGCKESDMTEQLLLHLFHIFITLNWNKLFLQRVLIHFSKKHLQAIIWALRMFISTGLMLVLSFLMYKTSIYFGKSKKVKTYYFIFKDKITGLIFNLFDFISLFYYKKMVSQILYNYLFDLSKDKYF